MVLSSVIASVRDQMNCDNESIALPSSISSLGNKPPTPARTYTLKPGQSALIKKPFHQFYLNSLKCIAYSTFSLLACMSA